MSKISVKSIVRFLSWLSWFALSWLMVTFRIDIDSGTIFFWFLFLLIAVIGGLIPDHRNRGD